MELDMYLEKHYYHFKYMRDGKKAPCKKLDGYEVKKTVCEAAYWRKANQIHGWFVREVQGGNDNCKEYEVSLDKLKELLALVNKVLETKDTNLLPPHARVLFWQL